MRSRRPEQDLPTFFVDRSLGRYVVPEGLKAAGLSVVVMADLHGEVWAQRALDVEWLPEVATRGYVVLSRDVALRRNDEERAKIREGGLRVFLLVGSQQLTGPACVDRFLRHQHRMVTRSQQPGPWSTASTRGASSGSGILASNPWALRGVGGDRRLWPHAPRPPPRHTGGREDRR